MALEPKLSALRSVKFHDGELVLDRSLVGFTTKRIDDLSRALGPVFDDLSIPDAARAVLPTAMIEAPYVHFGHETTSTATTVKVYFEHLSRLRRAFRSTSGVSSVIAYDAVKWRLDGSAWSHDTYEALVGQTNADAWSRVQEMLGSFTEPALEAIRDLMSRVPDDLGDAHARLLVVSDDHRKRRSVDISLARTRRTVADIVAHLVSWSELTGVSAAATRRLVASDGDRTIARLAAGVHMSGRPFVTLYFEP